MRPGTTAKSASSPASTHNGGGLTACSRGQLQASVAERQPISAWRRAEREQAPHLAAVLVPCEKAGSCITGMATARASDELGHARLGWPPREPSTIRARTDEHAVADGVRALQYEPLELLSLNPGAIVRNQAAQRQRVARLRGQDHVVAFAQAHRRGEGGGRHLRTSLHVSRS